MEFNTVGLITGIVFLLLVIGTPILGYLFMVLDIRAHLRSLRRMLVQLRPRRGVEVPQWARRETPGCLATFGLRYPCTEDELLREYRQRVKKLHPDHGGQQQEFLRLQRSFEEASRLLREGMTNAASS